MGRLMVGLAYIAADCLQMRSSCRIMVEQEILPFLIGQISWDGGY